MSSVATEKPLPRFLSLKWKALILTSLILLGIAAILSFLSYLSLLSQYQSQRNTVYQQYVVQAGGLIETSAQRLQQLGGMIPSLSGMNSALGSGDAQQIHEAFGRHWTNLQIDVGIELVRLYSKSNRLLGSWGDEAEQSELPSSVLGWVWQANQRETPVSIIDCSANCIQYAVVPMLADGRSVGVALIGRSLVDVILGFKKVSGTDIGVIVIAGDAAAGGNPGRWIPHWNANIVAITSPAQTLPILQRSADHQQDLIRAMDGMRTEFKQNQYEVRLIPLKKDVNAGQANLVVVTDITKDIARIRSDTRKSMVTAVAGFLVAESLLLALLWVPMSRLRRTALSLPLLSQSQYEEIRNRVSGARRRHHLDDETDILDHTAITLSYQLENLEQEAKEYAQTLAQRAEELAAQKDFVSSLLETAQAFIMTQNTRGEITMVNQYGKSLMGYHERELQTQLFTRFIAATDLTTDVYRDLNDLVAGRRKHLHHELCMVCKDGGTRSIAWYHSRPPAHGNGEPEILSVGIDITDRKNAEERLSWLAEHDPLTGLFNRRRFQVELEEAIRAAKHSGRAGALLFLDVDQFKDVNDSSGHPAGDVLLKDVAHILSDIMREGDLAARLGGDEFALIIPETNEEGAVEVGRRIKERLGHIKLILGGRIHRVSASIGIALFPRDGSSVNELLANADMAMYQAKESGRGCWHLFSDNEQVKEKLHQRVYWKARIEQALAEDQFVLYYQPIVDMSSGRATHFESLLRLRNKDGSIATPGEFIEIAETTGMIHRIDRMVVAKAIAQLEQLDDAGYDVSFSINLSAHAFSDPELFALIEENVKRIRFDPARLIFEVTETAAVADFAVARESMRAIRELGCQFALDDFGVGFSSFYALKQLPVDYVKIDGSFISQMHESSDDQLLVQALSQVAHGFGKKTVAEFVENESIIGLLREYGVDYAQGYFLGKPLPAQEAFARLAPRAQELRCPSWRS